MRHDWIQADWPAPAGVRAVSTTRSGGVSIGPWASLNLGNRCGDHVSRVGQNRDSLKDILPAPAQWLHQVHGSVVLRHAGQPVHELQGDALVSFRQRQVCAVLTADCLPVFFCNRSGDRVGIAHAGWRGLAEGVLQATVDALDEAPAELMAWMGPAIGAKAYEVGRDVLEAFPREFSAGFTRKHDRYLLDLYALAKLILAKVGIHAVYGGDYCTMSDPARFYSYRRDHVTGRMANLVWLDDGKK